MLKPLLRILPLLSGNVMINCTLSDYLSTDNKTYQCFVRGATLDPLSANLYRKGIKCNLLGSTYDYDLKEYYKYYRDVFYSSSFSWDKTDMIRLDKTHPIQNRNTDVEFGCTRRLVKNTGHTLEFFAPIYCTTVNDMPYAFLIECTFHTKLKDITKKIIVNIKSNYNSPKNFLYHYLNNYLSKINDNYVINLTPDTKTSTINGIDLVNGGIANGHDFSIKSLFESQQPINNFDYSICAAFKNCSMALKEVLPLSFSIDLDSIIDSNSVVNSENCIVTITGHYINEYGNEIAFYDWDSDYTTYSIPVSKMNDNTGVMEYVSGEIENIMDDGYPSLHESRMDIYKNSNKLTKQYSRWKTLLSDDEHPYIANLAFAFNRNQDSQTQYGQYPSQSFSLRAVCDVIKEGENEQYYNFRFPLGAYKSLYMSQTKNNNSVVKNVPSIYKNQFNSFAFNWFDIQNNVSSIFDKGYWTDMKDNDTYYKGIVHSMSPIYNSQNSSFEKIDKFGIFLIPEFPENFVEGDLDESIKTAEYTLENVITANTSKNCKVNSAVVSDYLFGGDKRKYSDVLFTSISPGENDINCELSNKEMFKKLDVNKDISTAYLEYNSTLYSYTYFTNSSNMYIDLRDTNIQINDINGWRDINDVIEASSNLIENNAGELKNSLLAYTAYFVNNHADIEKITDIALQTIYQEPTYLILSENNAIKDSAINSIAYTSYEMLPIHVASFLCDDQTYNGSYYIKFSGSLAYTNYSYALIEKIRQFGETEWQYVECKNDGVPIYLLPGYAYVDVNGNNGELSLVYTLTKYGFISNPDPKLISGKVNGVEYSYLYEVNKVNRYVDDLVKQIYVSSSSNAIPKHLEHYIQSDKNYSSYLLVELGTNDPRNAYEYSIWRKSRFVRTNLFDSMKANAVDDITTILETSKIDNKYITNTYINTVFNVCTYAVNNYVDKLKTQLEDKEIYNYIPAFFGDGKIYAKNGFVKIDKEKQNKGNRISSKDIDSDIDVLWVDTYNISNVLRKYKIEKCVIDSKLLKRKKMFARFLDKDHMYWWYTELCKDAEYVHPVDIWNNWQNHLFVKRKKLHNINGKLNVVDVFVPMSKIPMDKNTAKSFKYFFDNIEYNTETKLWNFRDRIKNYSGSMEIVFDIDVIRLDKDLYNKVMSLENDDKEYKDLYIYRIENEDEWELNFENTPMSKVEYDSNIEDKWTEVGHTLIPMFNKIYVEDKEETKIYGAYKLRDIRKTIVNDGDDEFYRYDSNDIPWMIGLTTAELNELSTLCNYTNEDGIIKQKDGTYHIKTWFEKSTRKRLEDCLYYKFISTSINLVQKEDDLQYNYPGFSTHIGDDGTKYGYWMIKLKLDNTVNAFNIFGVNSGIITNNIKAFKYINGHNIFSNKKYFNDVLMQMLPFCKVQPSDVFRNIKTIISPSNIHFKCRFKQNQVTNNDINTIPIELETSVSDMQTNLDFQRYFGWLVPVLNKTTTIYDQWLLKLKDADTKMLETGEYPSIDDFAMYKDTLSINAATPMKVYTVNIKRKNYSNNTSTFLPVEYKQFNASIVINAKQSYKYVDPHLRQYNYIKEITDISTSSYEENLYKVFCMMIKGTEFYYYIDDEEYKRKYLFNLYDGKITSEPVKLTFDKSAKLYKVTYTFELK